MKSPAVTLNPFPHLRDTQRGAEAELPLPAWLSLPLNFDSAARPSRHSERALCPFSELKTIVLFSLVFLPLMALCAPYCPLWNASDGNTLSDITGKCRGAEGCCAQGHYVIIYLPSK